MNALAAEKSPYLRQHADNPVDWLPWGEAAFAQARTQGKPIFLSIGYSTCHWCHVMAHESFESEAVAALLRADFIAIKVDREERPDVDHLYMRFVQATTGQGGWPMSVWMTPELKPFYGGTYYPPEDRYGRPGFSTLLRRIAELWKSNQASLVTQSEQVLEVLAQTSLPSGSGEVPSDNVLRRAYQSLESHFEPRYGGFSEAPKFPRPVSPQFLLRYAERPETDPDERARARKMTLVTLDQMKAGGMYDHLGGGFHRYSVDAEWHVPHFEKMLYDQAQLTMVYTEAYQLTGQARYAQRAHQILDYVRKELTSPEGGFYCAEDADSLVKNGQPEHAEGAFYVWSQAEIESHLGPDLARLFCRRYGVKPEGNSPPGSDPHGELNGKNTLIDRYPQEPETPALLEARAILFNVRALRPRPHRDQKILTAWNGLMISAFARASVALGRKEDFTQALQAAEFIWNHLRDSSGYLLRSYCESPSTIWAFAADYAFTIQGLLDLYEAQGEAVWLRRAWDCQQQMDALFWDARSGGYFEASAEDPHLLLRLKEDYDGAEPSANSVAALNLIRLADWLGEEPIRLGAKKVLAAGGELMTHSPGAVPALLSALIRFSSTPLHLVLCAPRDDPRAEALWREFHRPYLPQKSALWLARGESLEFLGAKKSFFEGLVQASAEPTAYVCEGWRCHSPVREPDVLRALLKPLGSTSIAD